MTMPELREVTPPPWPKVTATADLAMWSHWVRRPCGGCGHAFVDHDNNPFANRVECVGCDCVDFVEPHEIVDELHRWTPEDLERARAVTGSLRSRTRPRRFGKAVSKEVLVSTAALDRMQVARVFDVPPWVTFGDVERPRFAGLRWRLRKILPRLVWPESTSAAPISAQFEAKNGGAA
jgi:hypothetical protein